MKGPGIKDYLAVIDQLKKEAIRKGEKKLTITSKALHAKVTPEHATMPTCCVATYKRKLVGDEILQRPKGTTGFGSHLTVCFDLCDLDGRERMFPNKKRGRPAKSEEEKAAARKAKMRHNTENLGLLIARWLEEHGWNYIIEKERIEASKEEKRWVINVQGIRRGRKQTLPVKLSEAIKLMDREDTHYSIAFNDSIAYRRQWNEIPQNVKERLHVSVILADRKGNIVEI